MTCERLAFDQSQGTGWYVQIAHIERCGIFERVIFFCFVASAVSVVRLVSPVLALLLQ